MAYKNTTLSIAGGALRILGWALSYWKAGLLVLFVLSPVGPHVLTSYDYVGSYQHKRYTRCTYLGSRGFIIPNLAPDCPMLAFLDAREWQP